MKPLRFIILLLFLLILFNSFTQKRILNERISFDSLDCNVFQLFDTLAKKYNVKFAFNPDILDSTIFVWQNNYKGTIENLLNAVIDTSNLAFDELEDYIVIFNKAPNQLNPEKDREEKIKAHYLVKGKIIEKGTKIEIPFAHIYLKHSLKGTISNEDGKFQFLIPDSLKNDTIIFSCLGFLPRQILVKDIQHVDMMIYLSPSMNFLNEITVKNIKPQEIIQNVIKNITKNYGRKPYMMQSFYRELISCNNKYISVAEAVNKIYKSSYSKQYDSDRISIYRGRKKSGNNGKQNINFKLQGGIYNTLLLDVIKNTPSFLHPEYIQGYTYTLKGMTADEYCTYFILEFIPKEYSEETYFAGKLYIDIHSYALKKAEFQINQGYIRQMKKFFIKKHPKQTKAFPVHSYWCVEYRSLKGKWFLSYARSELDVKVITKKPRKTNIFSNVSEFIITDVDSINVKQLNPRTKVKSTDIFVDLVEDYDEYFWGKENIIHPDIDILKAYKQLNISPAIHIILE